MKKWMGLLLAALAVCMAVTALGEEAPAIGQAEIDAFSNTWVQADGEGFQVNIWESDGEFVVFPVRFNGEDEVYSVEFDSCVYDAEQNAILCEGGTLLLETSSDEDEEPTASDEDEDEDEDEETNAEILASGFSAVLTLDEEGRLQWTGSGDAMPDQTYIAEIEEDDGMFVGEWECGDASMYITLEKGVYNVSISITAANVFYDWEYTCALDESGALVGKGDKAVEEEVEAEGEDMETLREHIEGNAVITGYVAKEEYHDGEAAFTLDHGAILWNDAVENAGRNLRFERAAEETSDWDEDMDEDLDEDLDEDSDEE